MATTRAIAARKSERRVTHIAAPSEGAEEPPLAPGIFLAALRDELRTFAEDALRKELEDVIPRALREELVSLRQEILAALRENRQLAETMPPAQVSEAQDDDGTSTIDSTAWVTKRRVNPFFYKLRPSLTGSLGNWLFERPNRRQSNVAYQELTRVVENDDASLRGDSEEEDVERKGSSMEQGPSQRRSLRRTEPTEPLLPRSSSGPRRSSVREAPRRKNSMKESADERKRGEERRRSEVAAGPGGDSAAHFAAAPGAAGLQLSLEASDATGASRAEEKKSTERLTLMEKVKRKKTLFTLLVDTVYFEYVSFVWLLLNMISIGIQTEYMATSLSQQPPQLFGVLDHVFAVVFSIELVLRISAFGQDFFCGEGCFLNIFDLVIIVAQVFEELFVFCQEFLYPWGGGNELRFLRFFRFLRILRLTRVLASIGDLRTLMVSIGSSMKSLVWVIILLGMLTFAVGVLVTQIVTAHMVQYGEDIPEEMETLRKYYGSVGRSMLSLFEAVTEGIHWGEVMEPLVVDCSPWLLVVFLLYIAFTLFALLNVVTGLFVEAAINAAEEDKKQVLAQQMCNLFIDLDRDSSGAITWEEFEINLQNPQMMEYLKVIDLDPDEAAQLFNLLDEDGSGEIDAEELVSGCLRLHGNAKALELAAFMQEFRKFTKRFNQHARHVELRLLGQAPRLTALTASAPMHDSWPIPVTEAERSGHEQRTPCSTPVRLLTSKP